MRCRPICSTRVRCVRRWLELHRAMLSVGIAATLALPNLKLLAQDQDTVRAPALKIEVIEGKAATNNIKSHKATEPVALVTDEKGQPVSGVLVVFTLPETGAGGSFADGSKRLMVYTDAEGKARARGFTANSTAGKFQIMVNASFHGFTASTAVDQTNLLPQGGKSNSKLIAILAIAGGAAVAGVVAAGSGSGTPAASSPASVSRTATTITAGTPVFGPPQ